MCAVLALLIYRLRQHEFVITRGDDCRGLYGSALSGCFLKFRGNSRIKTIFG